jgi:hypothetical protein
MRERWLNRFSLCQESTWFVYMHEGDCNVSKIKPVGPYRFITVEAGRYGNDFRHAFVYFECMHPEMNWEARMLMDVESRLHEVDRCITFEEFWKWNEWENTNVLWFMENSVLLYGRTRAGELSTRVMHRYEDGSILLAVRGS